MKLDIYEEFGPADLLERGSEQPDSTPRHGNERPVAMVDT